MEISRESNELSARQQGASSLDEQRNMLLQFAEESGYEVVGWYEDTDGHPGEGEELA